MLKKMTPIALVVLLATHVAGCFLFQPKTPIDESFCMSAQKNLLALQCPDSRGQIMGGPNKHGEEYNVVCARNIESGVPMYAECLSKVQTCKEIEKCFPQ